MLREIEELDEARRRLREERRELRAEGGVREDLAAYMLGVEEAKTEEERGVLEEIRARAAAGGGVGGGVEGDEELLREGVREPDEDDLEEENEFLADTLESIGGGGGAREEGGEILGPTAAKRKKLESVDRAEAPAGADVLRAIDQLEQGPLPDGTPDGVVELLVRVGVCERTEEGAVTLASGEK